MRTPTSRHRTAILALAVLVAAAACGPPTQVRQDVELDTEFWLDTGGMAIVRRGPTVIRFIGVLNDSRCPTDALIQCVSAGNARLQFTATSAAADVTTFELNSTEGPSSADIDGLRLRLLELAPAARLEPPIEAGEYRARLIVTASR